MATLTVFSGYLNSLEWLLEAWRLQITTDETDAGILISIRSGDR
ncbi:MAG: hypothetical protein ACI3YG_04405 [Prevotella sp.]